MFWTGIFEILTFDTDSLLYCIFFILSQFILTLITVYSPVLYFSFLQHFPLWLSLQCINFYILFFLHLLPLHFAPSMFFSLSLYSSSSYSILPSPDFLYPHYIYFCILFYLSILFSILSMYFHLSFIILVSS